MLAARSRFILHERRKILNQPPTFQQLERQLVAARNGVRVRPPAALIVRPGAGQESVWDYPRPPRVEAVYELVTVNFAGTTLVATHDALRVVETAGAPTVYVPMHALLAGEVRRTARWTICEWKGVSYYYDLILDTRVVEGVGWSYPEPFTDLGQGYERLSNRIAFYPSRLDCRLGEERVRSQPGGYYGGWVTSSIVGPLKGSPGSENW